MKTAFCCLLLTAAVCAICAAPTSFSQNTDLGIFENHSDVGQVKNPGGMTYEASRQEYTITGSGTNMWLGMDEFHFVWKRMKGNFILTALARFVGKGVEP